MGKKIKNFNLMYINYSTIQNTSEVHIIVNLLVFMKNRWWRSSTCIMSYERGALERAWWISEPELFQF